MKKEYKLRFVFPKLDRPSESNIDLGYLMKGKPYIGTPNSAIPILAALTPSHYHVSFIDDRIENINIEEDIDLVAISSYTPQGSRAFEIADIYREKGVKTILGGMFPTALPEEAIKHADSVCIGEGEPVWARILGDFENNSLEKFYQSVPQYSYDFSNFPVPKYELLFEKEKLGYYNKKDYPIQVTRGCAQNCFNCVIPTVMGNKLRYKPLCNVAAEIDKIKLNPERDISITDDTLPFLFLTPIGKEYYKNLCSLFISKGAKNWDLDIYFSVLQVSFIQKLLESMKQTGLMKIYAVFLNDPLSRKIFSKDCTTGDFQDAVDIVKRIFDYGFDFYASIFIGLDCHDSGTSDRILTFLSKTGIKTAEFMLLTPHPGTLLWKIMNKENRIFDRIWRHYNDANVVFKPKNMTPEDLLTSYKALWKEFYKDKLLLDFGYTNVSF